MNLQIRLFSMSEIRDYEFDYLSNTLKFNGEVIKKDIQTDFVELMGIIKPWNKSLINENVVDGLVCEIKYREAGKEKEISFINDFPENFEEMLYILDNIELEGVENE